MSACTVFLVTDQWEGKEEDRYHHDPTYGYTHSATLQFPPPYPLCESASTIYDPHPYPGPGSSGSDSSSYQIE